MFKEFNHSTPIQIRFKDIDKQGHVNNAIHHTYVETGRIHYFDDVLGRGVDWDKTGLILARVEMDFKEPIFIEDEIVVHTRVSRLGRKSFDMTNLVIKKTGDSERICSQAKSTIVCYNYVIKETIEIPEQWIEKFKQFEKNKI